MTALLGMLLAFLVSPARALVAIPGPNPNPALSTPTVSGGVSCAPGGQQVYILVGQSLYVGCANGSVGINNGNPIYALDIIGALRVNGSSGTLLQAGTITTGGYVAVGQQGIHWLDGSVSTTAAGPASGGGWTRQVGTAYLTFPADAVVVQSTLTVQGSALSVGGSNLSVDANQFSTSKPLTVLSSGTFVSGASTVLIASGTASDVAMTVGSYGAAGAAKLDIQTLSHEYFFQTASGISDDLRLYDQTNGIERFRMTKGGNFGINTMAPLATLHVAGTQSTTGAATFGSSITATGGFQLASMGIVKRATAAVFTDNYYREYEGGGFNTFAGSARRWVSSFDANPLAEGVMLSVPALEIVTGETGSISSTFTVVNARVGIGTNSPLATLHVAGTQSNTGAATFGSSVTILGKLSVATPVSSSTIVTSLNAAVPTTPSCITAFSTLTVTTTGGDVVATMESSLSAAGAQSATFGFTVDGQSTDGGMFTGVLTATSVTSIVTPVTVTHLYTNLAAGTHTFCVSASAGAAGETLNQFGGNTSQFFVKELH